MSAQRVHADLTEERPDVVIRAMLTPDRAIDDFLADGLRRGWSERTLATYRRILNEFAERLPLDYDVTDIKPEDVRRYLGAKKGRSRGTIAHAESVLSSWFKWLFFNSKIKTSPMARIERTRRIPASELDVVTVSTDDVPLLFKAAAALDLLASTAEQEVWTHRVCIAVLAFLGPRRSAVAKLRRRDYDTKNTRIRFQEKGAKTIWKPVPDELGAILNAAIAAGAIVKPTDFLVPPAPNAVYTKAVLAGEADRDGRCIWEIVKSIGREAGVETHVHALRAAFAVFYLEQNPGDIEGLRELLGHRNIATTAIYLRKLNTQQAMERVRGLSWGNAA